MGSDRKSKEKEKIRKRSYSSGSEDEGKSKRHKNTDEDRKSKKGDKERRKDRKSHKHRSDKDKKSKDKHRSKHHKSDNHSKHDFQELSGDDYFAKNNEFATWLKDEKHIFFSDLTTESARELFSGFVKAWNKGKLGSQYYQGIATGPRTAHNWKIK